jgi:hypothetical protein
MLVRRFCGGGYQEVLERREEELHLAVFLGFLLSIRCHAKFHGRDGYSELDENLTYTR